MKKINFKNLFKKKDKPEALGPSAAWPVSFVRDWKIIVWIFAVGMISLSVFCLQIYLSNKIAGGFLASPDVTSDVPVKTINLNKLKADILIMETRQADYLNLKSSSKKPGDPSL